MKLTLLGTGTPVLETARQGSAVLLEVDDENLLFDTGRGVINQLLHLNFPVANIDVILLTHHHWDHIGDLGDILIAGWHAGRSNPIHIYGPQGTQSIVSALLNEVFRREIEFNLKVEQYLGNSVIDLREIVEVHEVKAGLIRSDEQYRVYAEYVDHGNTIWSQTEWPCLGYRVETINKIIAISGDTIPCQGLENLAQNADVLVQCCYLAEAELTTPYFEFMARNIIASSGHLGKLATLANVKQLVLTHFRKKTEAMMQSIVQDIQQDYSGDIVLGYDLLEINLD